MCYHVDVVASEADTGPAFLELLGYWDRKTWNKPMTPQVHV